MSTELLVKVPWGDVAIVISKLIKFSKGGISKSEASELISLLAVLGAQISVAVGPELTEDTPPKKKKR